VASQVDIYNLALTLLGQEPCSDVDDDTASVRAFHTNYDVIRDAELSSRWWRFSVKRVEVAALVAAPEGNDFTLQYQLPVDFLSLIRLGDAWQGYDASDYRTGPSADYSIEADKLLTNYAAPLLFVYCAKLTETSLYHPCFVDALAAKLAYVACEKITGSTSRQEFVMMHYRNAINRAMVVNAVLSPPQYRADNSWMVARLG
jgi:hypothetical protein